VGRRGTTEQPWMHTSELASDELARAATESHSRWWKWSEHFLSNTCRCGRDVSYSYMLACVARPLSRWAE
jgi:hypothetical protein